MEMEILICIIVLICILILFIIFNPAVLSKFTGGVKTNFLGRKNQKMSVKKCIDIMTDIVLVFPPGYASLCYKFFIKQANRSEVSRLKRALRLKQEDNVKDEFYNKLGDDGIKIVSEAVKRYDDKLVLKWLEAADVVSVGLEPKLTRNIVFNRGLPEGIISISCLEALICLHYYDNMDLTVISQLGMGGFNAVYLCKVGGVGGIGGQTYALRINVLRPKFKPDQDAFEEYKQTCELIAGHPKFPIIYHGSHEYEHLAIPSESENWSRHSITPDSNPEKYDALVVWALTKRYDSIEFVDLSLPLLVNYCSSMVDVVNFIHTNNKIFIDWKYRNFLYDPESDSYILTDFDLSNPAIHHKSFVHTHKYNFPDDVKINFSVVKRLGAARNGIITIKDVNADYEVEINRITINKQIDSLVAMKDVVSIMSAFYEHGPSEDFHGDYNRKQKATWNAEELLTEYNKIETQMATDFRNEAAVLVFLDEGKKLLQDCVESIKHFKSVPIQISPSPSQSQQREANVMLDNVITMDVLEAMMEEARNVKISDKNNIRLLVRAYYDDVIKGTRLKAAIFSMEFLHFFRDPDSVDVIKNILKDNISFTMRFLIEELVKKGYPKHPGKK